MRSAVRATWLSVKASYWFIPALLTFASLLLAIGTIRLDRMWGTDWLVAFAWFEGIGPEGARAQLTVIAGAMIAISSTVFAITIAAVVYASGNYGPRLLTNFMNDRGNQVSLGVFVATFVYNLLVLRSVRNPADSAGTGESPAEAATAFVPQLSMLVSGASVLIAVAVLVYFLHHIPASIRINSVLGVIGRRLIGDIEKRFPLEGSSDEPEPPPRGRPVTARSVGYIEIIDFAELDELAERHGLRLALKVRTGDFVHPHLPMIEVEGVAQESLDASLLNCFSLGNSRTPAQDLEFLVDELVEIGLRALSPGINDPFTAITCLHWLAAAMAKLADRSLRAGPEQETYRRGRVVPVADDFRHFLARGFGAMRQGAATNPVAAKVFVDALHGVARGATSAVRRAALAEEVRRFGEQVETALQGPARDEVRQRIADLRPEAGSAFGR
ncbi:DUF2254 domain-containing protein [Sphingosinicella sp. CPCC 101087]|uniref:DUF2254 domain-containing protein n=1 Tax=Sphingosinicella sp. CPCC 101087 TaxID=2497754 RepID=UPI00101D739E|nr:DUF2254 domain-containing protein [Sphingosinicella sp. CPCC 101087]